MIDLGGDDRGWRGPSPEQSGARSSRTLLPVRQWKRPVWETPTLDDIDRTPVDNEPKVEYVTGYPFMQLAKRHGLDYGDVLITAQWMQTNFVYNAPEDIRRHLMKIPPVVATEIGALIGQPVYLRGAIVCHLT